MLDSRAVSSARVAVARRWSHAVMHPPPLGRYRHFKGREYTVLAVARHSETLELFVVYRQEYGDHGLWVRPAAMFAETVMVDGRAVPRFMACDAPASGG